MILSTSRTLAVFLLKTEIAGIDDFYFFLVSLAFPIQ